MNVLDLTRSKIEHEVLTFGSSSDNWRVFIYDIYTAKILGNLFSISDILSHNVLITYQMNLKREKINFPGLYFIDLNKENFNIIKNDIKNKIYTFFYVVIVKPSDYKVSLEKYENVQVKEYIIGHIPIEERVFLYHSIEEGIKSLFTQPIKKIYYTEKHSIMAERLFKHDKNGIEVLLLDRSIDLVSPLIHFFTFQAIIADYNLETMEEDELFIKIKHKHIAEVNKILVNESKSIVNTVSNIDNTSSKNLMQLVLEVPEQIKLKESISFYLKQLNDIFDFYEQKNKKMVELEQSISTGYNSDGSRFYLQMEEVFQLFFNDFLQKEDKLRLFLLLSLKISFQENELNSLLKKGVFTKEEIGLSNKIKNFNFKLEKKKSPFFYQTSRFIPNLHEILLDIIENRSKLLTLGEIHELSLRKTAFYGEKKKRVIVVLYDGSITYAEMCVIYEITKKMNVDIFLGGKYLYTPKEFIEGLKKNEI